MTQDQVRANFLGATIRDGALVLDGVELGELRFGAAARHRHAMTARARFSFQGALGLQGVRLTLQDPTDEQYQALRAGLEELYGPPDYTTDMTARWDFAVTIITVAREDSETETPSAVWLQYQAAATSAPSRPPAG